MAKKNSKKTPKVAKLDKLAAIKGEGDSTRSDWNALFSIRAAGDMTPGQRRDIAAWMRKQADALEAEGDRYSKRFIARRFL